MGKEYIIEHIAQSTQEQKRTQAYQAYMAECLRLLLEDVAAISTGKYISAKWFELCDNKNEEEDDRTGDEVAADVIKRIGLSFGGDSANGFNGTQSEANA